MLYEIVIRGYVRDIGFDELRVTGQKHQMTTLQGSLIDQSALQGVLHRISDLGMDLVSVNRIGEGGEPGAEER